MVACGVLPVGGAWLCITWRLFAVICCAGKNRDAGADAGVDVVLEPDEGVKARPLRLIVVGHCGDDGWMLAVLALSG